MTTNRLIDAPVNADLQAVARPSLGHLGRHQAVKRRPTLTTVDHRQQANELVNEVYEHLTIEATDESTCTPGSDIAL